MNNEADAIRWTATRSWLDEWPIGLLTGWRERRLARRTSLESLRIYRELAEREPALDPADRYEQVVVKFTGLDGERARDVLRRAEESFASWPVERPLNLRDVVQYLVVHECLNSDPRIVGTRTRLTTIVSELIPDNL